MRRARDSSTEGTIGVATVCLSWIDPPSEQIMIVVALGGISADRGRSFIKIIIRQLSAEPEVVAASLAIVTPRFTAFMA